MTDRFEAMIRDAARADDGHQAPTYHGAWRRGRRRRLVKRGVVAGAGAVLVAATMTIGLVGPGQRGTETDLAVSQPTIEPVTATAPPATTAPILEAEPNQAAPAPAVTGTDPDARLDDNSESRAESSADTGVDTRTDNSADSGAAASSGTSSDPGTDTGAENTLDPDPGTDTEVASNDPDPQASLSEPTAVGPTPSQPAEAAAPEPGPTATAVPDPSPGDPAPTAQPSPTPMPTPTPPATPTPETVEQLTAPTDENWLDLGPEDTTIAALAHDSMDTGSGRLSPCDSTGDGVADATCELFPPVRCQTADGLAAEYVPIDTDGDGVADWCVAKVDTWCDQSGDWVGDVPCLIRP